MSTNPETPEEATTTPGDAASIVGIPDGAIDGHADDSQTGENASVEDTGTAHPHDGGEDLTFLSDDLQAALRDNPDITAGEFIAAHREALERGYLRRDKFSRDKNALRAEQDELTADRDLAARYRALVRDPRVRQAIEPILAGGQADSASEEGFDIPEGVEDWTAAEVLQFMQKREKAIAERVRKQARDDVLGEINAPTQRMQEFDEVASRYAEDNDVSMETMEAAATLICEDTALLNSLTLETLPGALRLAVRQAESEARLRSLEDQARGDAEKIQKAKAASPRGQRGAAAPSKRSYSEENDGEFDADAQFEQLLQRLGESESDLDRNIFSKR